MDCSCCELLVLLSVRMQQTVVFQGEVICRKTSSSVLEGDWSVLHCSQWDGNTHSSPTGKTRQRHGDIPSFLSCVCAQILTKSPQPRGQWNRSRNSGL